jgi:hypothetical protein
LLLSLGADPSLTVRNIRGIRAMQLQQKLTNDYGVSLQDKEGMTALELAEAGESADIVQALGEAR